MRVGACELQRGFFRPHRARVPVFVDELQRVPRELRSSASGDDVRAATICRALIIDGAVFAARGHSIVAVEVTAAAPLLRRQMHTNAIAS